MNYPKKPSEPPIWWTNAFIHCSNSPSTWHESSLILGYYSAATNLHKIEYSQVTDKQYSDTEYLLSLLTIYDYHNWRNTEEFNGNYTAAILFLLKIMSDHHTFAFDFSDLIDANINDIYLTNKEYGHIIRNAYLPCFPEVTFDLGADFYYSSERPIGIALFNKKTHIGKYLIGVKAASHHKILVLEYS